VPDFRLPWRRLSWFHAGVLRLGLYARYWIPVGLWMALIFAASTDALSSSRTSRIIGPFLRWIHPGVSELTIHRVQVVVRKRRSCDRIRGAGAAGLARRAPPSSGRSAQDNAPRAGAPERADLSPWRWSHAGLALLVAVLYAVSDEGHQGFVPSRDGRVKDVLWDSAGAAAGLAGLWAWGRWKKRW